MLWAPWVPLLCSALHCTPRTWVCSGCQGTGGGRNLPSPHMRRLHRSKCLRFPLPEPPGLLGKWKSSSSPSL